MTRPGIYRHFKGGMYRVLFTAIDAGNGPDKMDRLMVVYVCLKNGVLFTRPEDEFSESVDPNPGSLAGDLVPRFAYVGDSA